MDLETLAESLVGGSARAATSAWLTTLPTVPDGSAVKRYLQDEAHLTSTADGVEAVRRFVQALAAGPSPADPVAWYRHVLQDRSLDLVAHGPEVAPTLPDALCRLDDAWTVWEFFAAEDDRPVIPARSVSHQPTIEEWLRDVVCSPAYRMVLDPGRSVSSPTGSVFSAFEEDRDAVFPRGTPANDCLRTLGKDPLEPPIDHALLKYRRLDVGPAHVPTAFDAGCHPHFIPAAAGARCGLSKNLATVDGAGGVREVVVRPFPVSRLDEPEFIGK